MHVDLRIVTFAERPELGDEAAVIGASVGPEYNRHGDVVGRLWDRLEGEQPDFQFALVDASDEIVALGFTLPCRRDATVVGLPAGIDGVFAAAFADDPPPPDTVCAVAAEVPPERRLAGLSGWILSEMRALAARHGFGSLIAPLRPTWKAPRLRRLSTTPPGRAATACRLTRGSDCMFDIVGRSAPG